MAGGKETPRQKMIGMMYLVLTALLALQGSRKKLKGYCAESKRKCSESKGSNKDNISKY